MKINKKISIIQMVRELGITRQNVYRILDQLEIERTVRENSSPRGPMIAYITTEAYQRVKEHVLGESTKPIINHEVQIRRAKSADADTIINFNCGIAWETEEKKLAPEIISSGVEALFSNPDLGFYLVAEINGEIVGSLMVTTEWSDWRNGKFWWVQSVYVQPEFRRRGIYRQLYQFVKELADDDSNVCGFRLYVERDNTRAQQTYTSLGMQETPYLLFEELLPNQAYFLE